MRNFRWTAALAAAVTLSACTNGAPTDSSTGVKESDMAKVTSSQTTGGTPSTTPASSHSSNPSDPLAAYPIPAAAKAHTQDGAKAFVMYYFQTLEKLDAKPQTGIIPALSTTACESCKEQEKTLRLLQQSGETYRNSGHYHWSQITTDPNSSTDTAVITFTQHIPNSVRMKGKKTVKRESASTQQVAVRAIWQDSGWLIDEVGID